MAIAGLPQLSVVSYWPAVSLCGTWMQQVAQGWLVYRLTGSAALLGLVSFAKAQPAWVLWQARSCSRGGDTCGAWDLIVETTAVFGVGLMTFSASRQLWLSLVILLGVGFSWMVLVAASNTLLQALAVDEMRGRVMSLFSMMLVGMAPLSSLLAGSLAALVGAPMTVAINGFFCLVAEPVLGSRLPRLREAAIPILVARGVIADPITEGGMT